MVFTLRHNIKGSVASLRAMPTLFFFVLLSMGPQVSLVPRLPLVLCLFTIYHYYTYCTCIIIASFI